MTRLPRIKKKSVDTAAASDIKSSREILAKDKLSLVRSRLREESGKKKRTEDMLVEILEEALHRIAVLENKIQSV